MGDLASNLTRCPHGRHKGDRCAHGQTSSGREYGCPGGISLGNPHLATVIGYDLGGEPIFLIDLMADLGLGTEGNDG